MNIDVPETLVSAVFDTQPLTSVLRQVSAELGGLKEMCATLKQENEALASAVLDATRRAEISQEQYTALYNVVGSLNANFSSIHTNFISRTETEKGLRDLSSRLDRTDEQVVLLQTSKIDKDSTFLEARVREVAHETSVRHLSIKDKESREWIAQQLNATEAKVSEMIIVSQRETRGQLELELDNVKGALNETATSNEKQFREIEQTAQLLASVMRTALVALETHERSFGELGRSARDEADEIHSRLRTLMRALGLEGWKAIGGGAVVPNNSAAGAIANNSNTTAQQVTSSTPGVTANPEPIIFSEQYDDMDDIERLFRREAFDAKFTTETRKHWHLLRTVNQQLSSGAAFGSDNVMAGGDGANGGSVDFLSLAEFRREDRKKRLDQRERARVGAPAGAVLQVTASQLSPGASALFHGPLFVALRNHAHAKSAEIVAASRSEILTDVGNQLQAVGRELRTKVGSQRAVELIQEFATKTVMEVTKPLTERMNRVESQAVSKEDFAVSLGNKADRMAVLDKVTNRELDVLKTEWVKKLEDAAQTLSAAHRDIATAVSQVERKKVDRDEPALTALLQLYQGGQLALVTSAASATAPRFATSLSSPLNGGAAVPTASQGGNGAKCLSCQRPLSAISPAPPPSFTPPRESVVTTGRVASEVVQKERGGASAEAVVANAADPPFLKSTAHPVSDWVRRLDAKHHNAAAAMTGEGGNAASSHLAATPQRRAAADDHTPVGYPPRPPSTAK